IALRTHRPADNRTARRLLRMRARLRLRLGLDLLGAEPAAPQHRNPGGDELAGARFGVVVGERREAKLHELVVPRRDTEKAVLGLGPLARQMKRRALESCALGRIVD